MSKNCKHCPANKCYSPSQSGNMTRELASNDAADLKDHHRRNRYRRKLALDAEARWEDAILHAQLKQGRRGAHEGRNDPKTRWKRAVVMVSRLRNGQGLLMQRPRGRGRGVKGRKPKDKNLEIQHWLELVDSKHRYGSNLRYYHRTWRAEETTDNFFRWLDYGAGKDLSLPECPRKQLERERILYLSAEQRLNYLVRIDPDGKLFWAWNNELVDTTAGKWKDLGDGLGITPADAPEPPATAGPHRDSFSDSNSSVSEVDHYLDPETRGGSCVSRTLKDRFTTAGWTNRLLRKTVRRNTWIYVTDEQYNIFIGIKDPGSFQHSSFLSGGRVTSAGLITVQDGIISSLSPLSGHYRTSIQHFRDFVDILDQRGAHLDKMKVSKAEAILWGLEHYGRFRKEKSRWLLKLRKNVKNVLQKSQRGVGREHRHFSHDSASSSDVRQGQDGEWRGNNLDGRKVRDEMGQGQESTSKDANRQGKESQFEVQVTM